MNEIAKMAEERTIIHFIKNIVGESVYNQVYKEYYEQINFENIHNHVIFILFKLNLNNLGYNHTTSVYPEPLIKDDWVYERDNNVLIFKKELDVTNRNYFRLSRYTIESLLNNKDYTPCRIDEVGNKVEETLELIENNIRKKEIYNFNIKDKDNILEIVSDDRWVNRNTSKIEERKMKISKEFENKLITQDKKRKKDDENLLNTILRLEEKIEYNRTHDYYGNQYGVGHADYERIRNK